MKKRHVVLLAVLVVCMLMSVGCADKSSGMPADVRTFADWTENEVFQNVPALEVENTKVGKVTDCGGGVYQIDVSGTEIADYQDYLKTLEACGFKSMSITVKMDLKATVFLLHTQRMN